MINHHDIAQLLRAKLGTVTDVPPIATENVQFTPNPTAPHLREFCLFGDTFSLGLAADSGKRMDGVYQIDVCVPKLQGKYGGLRYVGKLIDAFARFPAALVSTDTLTKINLEDSSCSPGRIDGEYWVYSLSVRYTVVT